MKLMQSSKKNTEAAEVYLQPGHGHQCKSNNNETGLEQSMVVG